MMPQARRISLLFVMATYTEIIHRATEIASGVGADPALSPLIDSEMTAEALFPHALRFAAEKLARSEENLHDVARSYDIEIIEGKGTLPDTILRDFLHLAVLPQFPMSTYKLNFSDYERRRFSNQLCYFTFLNGEIHTTCFPVPRKLNRLIENITYDTNREVTHPKIVFAPTDLGRAALITPTVSTHPRVETVVTRFIDESHIEVGEPANDPAIPAKISLYDLPFTLDRTINNINVFNGSNEVFQNLMQSVFTEADRGRIVIVRDTSEIYLYGTIEAVLSDNHILANNIAFEAASNKTAYIYKNTIKLVTPGLPDIPVNVNDPINMSEKLVDETVITLAAAMRGQIILPTAPMSKRQRKTEE